MSSLESLVKCLRVWHPLVIVATTRLFAQTGSTGGPTPAVEPMLLEREKTIERQLSGGQSHEYQFALNAGQYARVRADQRSINVAVACFGPGGKELLAADAYPIGDAEDAELIGDISGIYRLRVTASEPHAPNGRYQITLREIGPATERHRE